MDLTIKLITKLFVFSSILTMSGCGDNPLLGEWVHVGNKVSDCKVLRFTPDREYCDSMSYEVSYEVSDSSILVKPDQKSVLLPVDISYSIISKNIISYTNPLSRKEVIFSRKGTSEITIEAIEYSKKIHDRAAAKVMQLWAS